MTKRVSSKNKIYLQLGVNVWGKAPFLWSDHKKDKWKNTPGEHRKKHRTVERVSPLTRGESINDMLKLGYLISKPSNKVKLSFYEPKYASQLKEKQKLRKYYSNVTEKQFSNYFNKAKLYKGKIGDNLIKLLERRLDTALYRAHFVNSMYHARQLINHGHVFVNGHVQNITGYCLKTGDVIQICPTIVDMLCTQFKWDVVKKVGTSAYRHTQYLEIDYRTMTFVYLYTPTIDEVNYSFTLDMNKVIRYYV